MEKIIAAGSNINLGQTMDGTSPILIEVQRGHATVVEELIVSRCNVDLSLTTNGSTSILLAVKMTILWWRNSSMVAMSFEFCSALQRKYSGDRWVHGVLDRDS